MRRKQVKREVMSDKKVKVPKETSQPHVRGADLIPQVVDSALNNCLLRRGSSGFSLFYEFI